MLETGVPAGASSTVDHPYRTVPASGADAGAVAASGVSPGGPGRVAPCAATPAATLQAASIAAATTHLCANLRVCIDTPVVRTGPPRAVWR